MPVIPSRKLSEGHGFQTLGRSIYSTLIRLFDW